jgi:hypothetical protein
MKKMSLSTLFVRYEKAHEMSSLFLCLKTNYVTVKSCPCAISIKKTYPIPTLSYVLCNRLSPYGTGTSSNRHPLFFNVFLQIK